MPTLGHALVDAVKDDVSLLRQDVNSGVHVDLSETQIRWQRMRRGIWSRPWDAMLATVGSCTRSRAIVFCSVVDLRRAARQAKVKQGDRVNGSTKSRMVSRLWNPKTADVTVQVSKVTSHNGLIFPPSWWWWSNESANVGEPKGKTSKLLCKNVRDATNGQAQPGTFCGPRALFHHTFAARLSGKEIKMVIHVGL